MKIKRILMIMDSLFIIKKLLLILLILGLNNISNCKVIDKNELKFNKNDQFKPINLKITNPILKNLLTKNNESLELNKIKFLTSQSIKDDINDIKDTEIENKKFNNKKFTISSSTVNKNMKYKNDINVGNNDIYTLDPPQNMTISNEILKLLQKFILAYVQNTLSQSSIELLSNGESNKTNIERRNAGVSTDLNQESFDIFEKELYQFVDNNVISVNVPRAMETGRFFLFKGLKKLLWPLFIGVQIAKSILLALFLPSILGSLGKMVGKGLTQISGFNHPSEAVGDLEFKDTVYSLDDDYSYPRPEASDKYFHTQAYQGATENLQNNGNTLSRFGFGDQKLSFINNDNGQDPLDINSKSNILNENKNVFKDFLKVPASSLLLSNYDPFYSPLLSRIDSVYSQLNVNNNEECRSKLICLMYANPAKYAPYSNLVSAQLSRELNELRKPTTDNEEILRFFKYMHAAKDGQDGTDCEKTYESCTELKDSETPVMITTFNDINKLVQARKLLK